MMLALRSRRLQVVAALSAAAALTWLLLPASTHSQSGASTNYKLIATDAASMGYAASAAYKLYSTNGQSGGEGVASSANYRLQAGFLRRAFTGVAPPDSVGGIAEQPDATALPSAAPPSGRDYAPYMLSAAVAFIAAAGAAGWRKRRKRA